jgi:hypothetical protein
MQFSPDSSDSVYVLTFVPILMLLVETVRVNRRTGTARPVGAI